MSTALLTLALLIGLGVAIFLISLGLTGLGVLLTWVFPLTPFQGTILHLVLFSLAITLIGLTFLCERIKETIWGAAEEEPLEEVVDLSDHIGVRPTPSGVERPVRRLEAKVGRNEPCPCGSGKKYKFCCLLKA
jgi:hypothetical protein